MKIVADRDIPFLQGVLEPFAEVVYLRGDEIKPSDVADADAILTRSRTICDSAMLAGSKVRFIGTATIGYDHIDTSYCSWQGITVATAKGGNARGVLQWVSAALAWLADNRGKAPQDTTLGVIGVGNIGSLVRKYATEWGYKVMCSDPPREHTEKLTVHDGFYPLRKIMAQSDIITLHTPLTLAGPDATYHMVNREFLTSTKPDIAILNSSRGPVVGPKALHRAVEEKQRDFILDVWNNEPNIDLEVLEGIALGTPHIAGYSQQGKATATAMIVNGLASKFGLPLRNWFPAGGYHSSPRPISWSEMCETMTEYFDIAAESAELKAAPGDFEKFRNTYRYRLEYF